MTEALEPSPELARIVVGGVLVVSALALVPLAFVVARALAPRDRGEDVAPWTAGDVGAVLAAAVGCTLLVALLLGAFAPVPFLVQLSGSVATLALAVLLAALLARRAGVAPRAAFAARLDGLPRAALAGTVAYLLLLPGLLGSGLLWPAALQALGLEVAEQPVVSAMRALPPGDRPAALVLGVVVGPLLEELFFRGFLQRALARRMPALLAIGVASVAFAGLHGLTALGPVFLLSLLLGGVLQATGRVGASFCVHALFNAQTFVFLWVLPEVGRVLEGSPPGLGGG